VPNPQFLGYYTFAMTAIVGSTTQTELNIVPDFEVRLLLNPTAVLGPKHELNGTVLSAFDMPPTVTKLNVQFLDKCSKEIYIAGWSTRIRKDENENDLELTYKKRYAITNSDIDAALTVANNDGFNAGSAKYNAQVEWGYKTQTLSISCKKSIADSGNIKTDLPGIINSREMLIKQAPDKFDNFSFNKWGTSALEVSRIFGPVHVRRSIGLWKDMPLYIEIWPLLNLARTGIEYIVEASFKTTDHAIASAEQTNLAAYLERKSWFLAEDSLKTQIIMERY
jgi:hypothetical protein